MNLKSILLFVGGTIGVMVLSVFLLWQFGSNTGKPIAGIAGEKVHAKGDGKVEIVEFSDFQCPACQSVQEPLKELLKKNEGKVTFVFRHFPLTSIHKYAMIGAQAAEAAGKQGKFWEMHDLLFERQTDWSKDEPRTLFIDYAKELGLDQAKFVMDLESQEVKDMINKDIVFATAKQISATPTFFVNGIETPFNEIEGKIQQLIQ